MTAIITGASAGIEAEKSITPTNTRDRLSADEWINLISTL
jgi:hypothetical protein